MKLNKEENIPEAILFAEWIAGNNWKFKKRMSKWEKLKIDIGGKSYHWETTDALYKRFKRGLK